MPRKAWEQLGNLSDSAAKGGFCQLILTASGQSFESALLKAKAEKFNRIEREKIAERQAERKRQEELKIKERGEDVTLLSRHEEVLKEERQRQEAVYNQQQNVLQKQHITPEVDLASNNSPPKAPQTPQGSSVKPESQGSVAPGNGQGPPVKSEGQTTAAESDSRSSGSAQVKACT